MMDEMNKRAIYTNNALTAVCEEIEGWGLTDDEIRNLVADILAELDGRNEARWQAHQDRLMETGGPDDSTYRQQLRDAGRGHLVK